MNILKTEEFRFKGIRYTIAFEKIGHKNDVLFHATGHFNNGYSPKTIDAGKAHSKQEAMKLVKSLIMR